VIQRNHVLAIKYHRGVCLAVANPRAADKEWIWDFAKSHLHDNKDFHDTDNSLDSYTGSVLYWEFAGQAFLLGAAGTRLTSTTMNCTRRCSFLTLLVPNVGMVAASLFDSSECRNCYQNFLQRSKLLDVYNAKMDACEKLAGPGAKPGSSPTWSIMEWRLCSSRFSYFMSCFSLSGWAFSQLAGSANVCSRWYHVCWGRFFILSYNVIEWKNASEQRMVKRVPSGPTIELSNRKAPRQHRRVQRTL
jgi:hypothetical protein